MNKRSATQCVYPTMSQGRKVHREPKNPSQRGILEGSRLKNTTVHGCEHAGGTGNTTWPRKRPCGWVISGMAWKEETLECHSWPGSRDGHRAPSSRPGQDHTGALSRGQWPHSVATCWPDAVVLCKGGGELEEWLHSTKWKRELTRAAGFFLLG